MGDSTEFSSRFQDVDQLLLQTGYNVSTDTTYCNIVKQLLQQTENDVTIVDQLLQQTGYNEV
jgi:hypothetical protein